MNWFIFALICFLGWGCADVFYKKSSDENDKYSHLKLAVWVGLVMGIVAVVLWIIKPMADNETPIMSITNLVKYSPAALGYILSMVIGYAGMRYLEISIISPVQNASGALSAICMTVFFLVTGKMSDITEEFSALDFIGTGIIVVGVVALGIVEQKLAGGEKNLPKAERKYRLGALALLFPILYCIFDTIGTAADGIILTDEQNFALGETDVLVLYGAIFFIAGVIAWVYMFIRTKKPYNPFNFKTEWPKAVASLCEQFGQIFYVFAMAANPVVAAPMIASYCVCSVILSRIFLKEKLKVSQLVCVILVICGIVLLGISEGLAEM